MFLQNLRYTSPTIQALIAMSLQHTRLCTMRHDCSRESKAVAGRAHLSLPDVKLYKSSHSATSVGDLAKFCQVKCCQPACCHTAPQFAVTGSIRGSELNQTAAANCTTKTHNFSKTKLQVGCPPMREPVVPRRSAFTTTIPPSTDAPECCA